MATWHGEHNTWVCDNQGHVEPGKGTCSFHRGEGGSVLAGGLLPGAKWALGLEEGEVREKEAAWGQRTL